MPRRPEPVAQALEEEATREQEAADEDEREGPGDRAQRGEVVEEDLRQAETEESEASVADGGRSSQQTDDQEREADERPEPADGGVAALEVGLHGGGGDALGDPEDPERECVQGNSADDDLQSDPSWLIGSGDGDRSDPDEARQEYPEPGGRGLRGDEKGRGRRQRDHGRDRGDARHDAAGLPEPRFAEGMRRQSAPSAGQGYRHGGGAYVAEQDALRCEKRQDPHGPEHGDEITPTCLAPAERREPEGCEGAGSRGDRKTLRQLGLLEPRLHLVEKDDGSGHDRERASREPETRLSEGLSKCANGEGCRGDRCGKPDAVPDQDALGREQRQDSNDPEHGDEITPTCLAPAERREPEGCEGAGSRSDRKTLRQLGLLEPRPPLAEEDDGSGHDRERASREPE